MQGSIFKTTSDTEVLAHLIKRNGSAPLKDCIKASLNMIKGAFAYCNINGRSDVCCA